MQITLKDGKVRPAPGGAGGYSRKARRPPDQDQGRQPRPYGADFVWADEASIATRAYPPDVAVIDRTEWGTLIGTIAAVKDGDRVVARGFAAAVAELERHLPEAEKLRRQIARIEKSEIGGINHEQEQIRLRLRKLQLKGETGGARVEALRGEMARTLARYAQEESRLAELKKGQTLSLVVAADGGKDKELPFAQIVDVYFPNRMGVLAKSGHYLTGLWHFVSDDPRESNTEGGVFRPSSAP
jgi:phosphate transport system permease protein